MRDVKRICWVRGDCEYIADRVNDEWKFAERECGEVRWYDVPATPALLEALRSSLVHGTGAHNKT